ncbi:GNAT family N-acetyltransferase [Marisediminicola sp. LYQ134]|uniref:GNAT family N-acetyltransferase n=1 Tax=unclassified Marisediminicola TaxID=2618316 RepID=UPI00398309B9
MIEIREATMADAAVLHELAAATFPLACPPESTPEDIAAFIRDTLSEERMRDYVADLARTVLLAIDGPRAVGWAMTVEGEPTDADVRRAVVPRPAVELSKLYVRPDLHGAGLARRLVDASLDDARSRGAAVVWLGVNQQNGRANAFYAKSQFERVGTKHFVVGARLEDDYVRARVLEAPGE